MIALKLFSAAGFHMRKLLKDRIEFFEAISALDDEIWKHCGMFVAHVYIELAHASPPAELQVIDWADKFLRV